MTPRRIATTALAALLCCCVPAAAQAASLAPDKACYGRGDTVVLKGAGFTPSGKASLAVNGRPTGLTAPVGTTGRFAASTIVLGNAAATDTFVATDLANPALTATGTVRRAKLSAAIKPTDASPYTTRRITVAGFTRASTLYRHTVRGKRVSNRRVGRLRGPCGTGSFRLRLFTRAAPSANYRVQFDTSRSYKRTNPQRVTFLVSVRRKATRSAASAASDGHVGVAIRQVRG